MTEGPRDKCCNMQRANAHYSCYIQVSVCDCVISPGDTNGLFQLGPHEVFFFFFHSCLFVVLLVGWFVCFVWQQDYTEKTILRISPRLWWRICLNPETDQIKVWCGLRWRGGSWIFFSLTSPLQYITILLIPQSIILDLDEIKSGVIRWLVPVSEYILMWIRI